jgi:hypothetical protein
MWQRLPFHSDFRQRLPLTATTPPLSDSSLPQRADLDLPTARPAWRTPRLVNSHKKAVAAYLPASAPPAVGTTSGRRRCRVEAADGVLGIGSAFAPALRAEIQRGSSVQQSHTLLLLYSPIFVLAAAKQCRGEARLARCGLPPLVAKSWACAISPTQCVFTHTEPTPKQKAGSSWIANAIDACCVSARAALRVSASAAMALPTASATLPRFASFVSGSIEAIRHASISRRGSLCSPMRRLLLAWLSPMPSGPPHRLTFRAGSIERTTRSISRIRSMCEPTKHVCRYGCANSARRCAGRSAIACGKRLTSRPSPTAYPEVAVFIRGCRS